MGLIKAATQNPQTPVANEPEDVWMLIHSLSHTDSELRRMAARDLGGVELAVPAMAEQLGQERQRDVAEAMLAALGKTGSEDAVAALIELLRSNDAWLRNETIEVLKGMPQAIGTHMARLLKDPDPDVRIFAVNVLESLRHPQVVPWLVQVIEQDAHVNVCATALDLLAETGDESCLSALDSVQQRFSDEPYLQFVAKIARDRILESKGGKS